MANPSWFDYNVYMNNKLAQVQAGNASYTMEDLVKAFNSAGFTGELGAYNHFVQYGAGEEVSPNAYFDANQYYVAKAIQYYNSIGTKVTNTTITSLQVADVKTLINNAGMNAWTHYQQYGSGEGVDPSNGFDASAYCAAKAAVMGGDWTAKGIQDAITAAHMTVLEHFMKYAGTDDTTEITAAQKAAGFTVPAGEQVSTGATDAYTLTNGTDVATANVFDAPMVYNPGGTDRILSLQDEDVLTGTANRTDNTLNVTMGHINGDEATPGTVTPTLHNIQNVNINWTGNTNTLDLRYADSTAAINITRATADAGNVTVDNIGTAVAHLGVSGTASNANNVTFTYKDGLLAGTADSLALKLSDVYTNTITVNSKTADNGFETVNIAASQGVDLKALTVAELENVVISGSGSLKIADLTTENNDNEHTHLNANGGITAGSVGIRAIDASAFTGNLNLDISSAVVNFNDPANSGFSFRTAITGGTGDDKFWTNAGVGATSKTVVTSLNGGDGKDTLVVTGGDITNVTDKEDVIAKITNIETLELRDQTDGAKTTTVDFDAFDAALTNLVLRDEGAGVSTFQLDDMGAALASSGNITLHHGITTAGAPIVNVQMKDASSTADTFVINVVNDLNQTATFNYTLDIDGDNGDGDTDLTDGAVENVTINDNDTEANVVTLVKAAEHTGTVKLTGGTAGLTYEVASTLVASTVDAATQASDLILKVGKADQDIKLGTGSDLLTFDGIDYFTGSDSISDAGGIDTVRMAFSKDVSGTPTLSGVEKLQLVATDKMSFDMKNVSDVTELALLSDYAVDENGEIFSTGIAAGQVATTDVITLKNTNLSAINFFGDEDATTAGATVAATQTFNGLTLANNAADTVAVNISAPLTNGTGKAGNGITTYNLGQLTTHGVKTMTINVANEVGKTAQTNINNIYDTDLASLTLAATGSIDLGTITGNTTNDNMTLFDSVKVGGDVKAIVKVLGDKAVVNLGSGNDTFNALGSAGTKVTINGGDGNNTITGTAQADIITTGAGADTIDANAGDNIIKSGAGNDTVSAKNGSNTVDLGSGSIDKVTFAYDNAALAAVATDVVAGSGTSGTILFDTNNDGTAEATYGFAVGDGSTLSLKFSGAGVIDTTASTLDGTSAHAFTAVDTEAATITATLAAGQSNLVIVSGTAGAIKAGENIVLSGNADVFLDYGAGNTNYNVAADAGNDAIVISSTSTGGHVITGGAGADRIVLSAASGADEIVVSTQGDSTAAGWDIVSNFAAANDKVTFGNGAAAGGAITEQKVDLSADVAAFITVTAGVLTAGKTSGASDFVINSNNVQAILSYLDAKGAAGSVYTFTYDSDSNGTADSQMVVQTLTGADTVVELAGVTTAAIADIIA